MLSSIIDIYRYTKLFQLYLGKRIYIILSLSLIASLLEGFGLVMILPLLENIDNQTSYDEMNHISQIIYDSIGFFGLDNSLGVILLLISFIFLLKGAFTFLIWAFNAYLMGRLLKGLKARLFDSYSAMTYEFYTEKDTGHFTNLINEQPIRAINALQQLTLFGGHLINTLCLMLIAFFMTWQFGLLALVVGLLVVVIFKALNNYVRKLSRENAQENSNLNNWIIQALQSFKFLSSTSQLGPLRKRVLESIEKLTKIQIKTGVASGFTQSVREPIAVIFVMGIIFVQVLVFDQKLEPLFVAIIIFYRALTAALQVQSFYQGTFQYIGSMELVDKEFSELKRNESEDGSIEIQNITKGIILNGVTFKYKKGEKDTLSNISLNFPSLKSIAIVGESGSGKSTLLDLITLLNKPKEGEVLIDGISENKIKKASWRNKIGFVSQETVVFDDTIANNICMWKGDPLNDEALMLEVKEAAKKANILDFIHSLPEGFNSLVGDRGVVLSGGQRQRLFIARELFRSPQLLILDEATSALDSSSEKEIQNSIESLKGKLTVIIVAHRLSTIKNVDLIYVIDEGKLVEKGTFNELITDKNSKFSKLASMQSLESDSFDDN